MAVCIVFADSPLSGSNVLRTFTKFNAAPEGPPGADLCSFINFSNTKKKELQTLVQDAERAHEQSEVHLDDWVVSLDEYL